MPRRAYIYTNHNNWKHADTSDGTAKWTEIVIT